MRGWGDPRGKFVLLEGGPGVGASSRSMAAAVVLAAAAAVGAAWLRAAACRRRPPKHRSIGAQTCDAQPLAEVVVAPVARAVLPHLPCLRRDLERRGSAEVPGMPPMWEKGSVLFPEEVRIDAGAMGSQGRARGGSAVARAAASRARRRARACAGEGGAGEARSALRPGAAGAQPSEGESDARPQLRACVRVRRRPSAEPGVGSARATPARAAEEPRARSRARRAHAAEQAPHGGAAKSLREARWSEIWCRGGARRLPWQNAMRMPRLIGMLRPGESIVRTSKPLDFPRDHAKLVRRAWVPEELAAALGGLPAGSPEPPRRGSPERRREAAAKAAAALFGEQTRGDQKGWRGAAARSRAQAFAVSARRPVATPLPDDCERARAGATYEHDATYPPSEALAINATPKAWGFHCRAGAWSEDPVCELAFRPSMAEGGAGACRGAAAA